MDQAHRRRIEKHRQQMRAIAAKQRAQRVKPNIKPKVAPSTPHKLNKPDIDPAPYDHACYIVGGGPSLTKFNWSNLDGKFVIAINRAYEVLPNAQILYFTDTDYWQIHKNKMLKHKGMKYRGRIAKRPDIKDEGVVELQLQQKPAGWSDTFGELYHGSNSGYACIQVAAQLGFTTIYLLGFDMQHAGKYVRNAKNNLGVTHWHNGHRRTDPPSAYNMMLRNYKVLAEQVTKRKLNVINVNTPQKTALKHFPIKSVEEVFHKENV